MRPWRRARQTPQNDAPEPSADGVEDAAGRLRPARPWQASADAQPRRAAEGASAPAPSHPDVVLRDIAREGDTPAASAQLRAGSRLARLFRNRHRAAEDEGEGDEQFRLPDPSPAFDEPWLRVGPPVPQPTRDWSQPAAPPLSAPEVAGGSTPEPEANAPRPEPAPPPAVDLVKRRAAGGPARPPGAPTTSRPSPGPRLQNRRPRPTRASAAAEEPAARLPQTLSPKDGPDQPRSRTATGAAPAQDVATASAEAKDDKQHKPKRRWLGRLVRTSVIVVIAALAALLLRVFVVQPYYIPSASMEPTLHGCKGCNDDHVLVDKISYRIHGPKAGDIVVFHRPRAANPAEVPESVLIKRVIATGGDKIAIRKGRVYVNSLVLDEPYLNKDHSCYPTMNMARRTVPKNDVFVMGDNRCDSIDSRAFGPVPTSSIIGRAFAIIWPLNRIRLLH